MSDVCELVIDKFPEKINTVTTQLYLFQKGGYEGAFGICRNEKGEYTTTEIVESLYGSVEMPKKCPPSYKLVGLFHTHPESDIHSPGDVVLDIDNDLEFSCIEHLDGDILMVKCFDYRGVENKDKLKKYAVEVDASINAIKHDSDKKKIALKNFEDGVIKHGVDLCIIKTKIEF